MKTTLFVACLVLVGCSTTRQDYIANFQPPFYSITDKDLPFFYDRFPAFADFLQFENDSVLRVYNFELDTFSDLPYDTVLVTKVNAKTFCDQSFVGDYKLYLNRSHYGYISQKEFGLMLSHLLCPEPQWRHNDDFTILTSPLYRLDETKVNITAKELDELRTHSEWMASEGFRNPIVVGPEAENYKLIKLHDTYFLTKDSELLSYPKYNIHSIDSDSMVLINHFRGRVTLKVL